MTMKKEPKLPGQRQSEEEIKKKARRPRRFIVTGIFAVLITAVLTAGAFHFERIKNKYKQEIAKVEKTYVPLSKNAAQTEDTKKKRVDFYKRRFYIDFPLQYSYAAANLIRKITLIAAEEIQFSEIEIQPGNQTVTFLLTGYVKTDNKIKARTILLKFRQTLSRFAEVLHIETPTSKAGTAEKQVELYFTIHGEVEPQ
ncbi:MAG: hypothetical protein GTO45_39135 [Candidatus Aminicenantes bacterium]|nr:hypothetical protein [Candidatus Aminicenantes bacterium]NIN90806.1 hypothetical protein [Candidatus Aminicenantes bacterium]NIR11780.1 hypothetical protein [Candidatus Aminicenantes bacterium]